MRSVSTRRPLGRVVERMSRVCEVLRAEGSARATDMGLLFHEGCGIHIIGRSLCMGCEVRTNIELDSQLILDAMRVSGAPTKRAAVEAGLRLLVQTKAQAGIRDLRGTVQWEGDLDELRRAREFKADAGR